MTAFLQANELLKTYETSFPNFPIQFWFGSEDYVSEIIHDILIEPIRSHCISETVGGCKEIANLAKSQAIPSLVGALLRLKDSFELNDGQQVQQKHTFLSFRFESKVKEITIVTIYIELA